MYCIHTLYICNITVKSASVSSQYLYIYFISYTYILKIGAYTENKLNFLNYLFYCNLFYLIQKVYCYFNNMSSDKNLLITIIDTNPIWWNLQSNGLLDDLNDESEDIGLNKVNTQEKVSFVYQMNTNFFRNILNT